MMYVKPPKAPVFLYRRRGLATTWTSSRLYASIKDGFPDIAQKRNRVKKAGR